MKNFVTILILLVAAGCSVPAHTKVETRKAIPHLIRGDIVGRYERENDGKTVKIVFLDDERRAEVYEDGEKVDEGIWNAFPLLPLRLANEVHFHGDDVVVFIIETKDKFPAPESDSLKASSGEGIEGEAFLIEIAQIKDRKRTGIPKEDQDAIKKIK